MLKLSYCRGEETNTVRLMLQSFWILNFEICQILWFLIVELSCCRVEETKTAILPELVELTKDEKIEVRLAGLDTLVSVLPLLDNGEALLHH